MRDFIYKQRGGYSNEKTTVKRLLCLALAAVLLTAVLAGCTKAQPSGGTRQTTAATTAPKKTEYTLVPAVLWECGDQPDLLGNADSYADKDWTADETIENLYEPLRAKYPDYIAREKIGRDSSDTYDMWVYTFTPESYSQTIYIQSGVHNREKAAVFSLVRFLELMCESADDEYLAYIRNDVRLIVVPIVNPWGFSQPSPVGHDNNANGHNLNNVRRTDVQQETANVFAVLEKYSKEIACAIDYHSTLSARFGDYSVRYSALNSPNAKISNEIVNMLAAKNVVGREPDLHYHTKSSVGTYSWYFFATYGIPGRTVEHGDYVWDPDNKYTALPMTRATELIGNVIINYARQEFMTNPER